MKVNKAFKKLKKLNKLLTELVKLMVLTDLFIVTSYMLIRHVVAIFQF